MEKYKRAVRLLIKMENSNYGNEWHEQVSFSDLYFQITNTCRLFQSQWQVVKWKGCLYSKISLVSGLFKEKEFKTIQNKMEAVEKINTKRTKELYKQLFELEMVIDSKMNEKMPFLNIRKKVDIGGL